MTFHYCTTEDGHRILCLCTTGQDHDEDAMDASDE